MTEPNPQIFDLVSNQDNLLDCMSQNQEVTNNLPQISSPLVEDSTVMPALMAQSLTMELPHNSNSNENTSITAPEQPPTSSMLMQDHAVSQSSIIYQRPTTSVSILPHITELDEEGMLACSQQEEKKVNEGIMSQINCSNISVEQANYNNRQIQLYEVANNGQESEISSSLRVEISPGRHEECKQESVASDLLNKLVPSQVVQSQPNWCEQVQPELERQTEQIIPPIMQHIQIAPIQLAINVAQLQQANIVMIPAEGLFNRDAVVLEEEPTAPDYEGQNEAIDAIIHEDRNASIHQLNDPRQVELNKMLSQELHDVIAKDQCVEMEIEPLNYRNCYPTPMQDMNANIPMEIQEMKPNQQENQEEKQELQQILTEMNHEESHPVSHPTNQMFSIPEERVFTFGKPTTKPEQITPYFKFEGHISAPEGQNEETCPWTMSAVIDEQERQPAQVNNEIPQQIGNVNNGSMNVEHDNNFRQHPALSQIQEEIISSMVYFPDPVQTETKIEVNINQNTEQKSPPIFVQYGQNYESSSFTELQQTQKSIEDKTSNQIINIYRAAYGLVTSSPTYPIKRQGNIDPDFELQRQPPQISYQNQSGFSQDSEGRKIPYYAKKVEEPCEDPNDSNINQVPFFFGEPQMDIQPSQLTQPSQPVEHSQPHPVAEVQNHAEIALVNMVFEQDQPAINIEEISINSKLQVKNNGSNQKEKLEDHNDSVQIVDVRYNPNARVGQQRILQEETSVQYHVAAIDVQQEPPADTSGDHLAIHNSPIDLISQPEVSHIHSLPNIQNNGQRASNVQHVQTQPQPQPAFNTVPQLWGLPSLPSFIPAYIPFNMNQFQYIQPQQMMPQNQFIPQYSNQFSQFSSYLPSYHSNALPTISININRMNEISLNMFSNGNQQFIQPQIPCPIPSEHQRVEIPQVSPHPPPHIVQRPQERQIQEKVEPQKEVLVKKDASTEACLPLPEIESPSDRDRSNQRNRERDNRLKTKIQPRNNNEYEEEGKQVVEFKIGLHSDKYLLNQNPSDQDHKDFEELLQPYINLKFTPEPRNQCGQHLFKNGLIMLAMVKLIVRTSPTPFIINHIYEYINSTYQINKNRFGFIQEAVRAKEVYQDYLDKQYLERYVKKRDEIHHQEEVIKRRVLNIAPQVAICELMKNTQPLPVAPIVPDIPSVIPRGKSMAIDSSSYSINEKVCAFREQPVKETFYEKKTNYVQYDIKMPIIEKNEAEQKKAAPHKYSLTKVEEPMPTSPTEKDRYLHAQRGADKVIDKNSTSNMQKQDILIKLSQKLLKTDDHKQKEKQAKTQERASLNVTVLSDRKKNEQGQGDNNKYLDLFQKYKKIRQIKKIDPKSAKPIDIEEKKISMQVDTRSEIKPEELTDKRSRRVQFMQEPASRQKEDDLITNEEDDEENGRKKKKGKSKGKPKRDTSAQDSEQDDQIHKDNRRKRSQTKK